VLVRGAASQTANLQEWQNSAGAIRASIASDGTFALPSGLLRMGTAFDTNTVLSISNTQGVQTFTSNFKAIVNQTSNQMQFMNSSATVQGGRNALAQMFTGSALPVTSSVGGATTATSGDGTTATLTMTSATNLAIGDLIYVAGITPTGYNTSSTFGAIVTAVSNTSPFTVSYANTTTGAQTVAGTVSTPAQASVTARSAGTKGLIVRGAASQTANLQEWQNATPTILTAITGAGTINFASGNTSATATAGAITAPALVTGFITMQIAGTTVKVPYYSN
jgi:hypothetical protein